ncbi:MAG: DegV family EDD domain-containing protein [Chloroflexi bacterium]|nr:DegV family EDD domain-containing protein [Chloroflexota bacterium]
MGQVRIVTDSAAEVDPEVAEELGIIVVPLQVRLGDAMVVDSADMRTPAFHEATLRDQQLPQVVCPPSRAFRDVYSRLSREADDIVSIHTATFPCNTYRPANEAAATILGGARIEVIDSTFMSAAMGAIVVEAARAAKAGADGPEVIRRVRGTVPHTYLAFFVDSVGVLKRSGALKYSEQPLPPSGGGKPLFVMEDGVIGPQFRMRNKGTALERLVEFVAEFLILKRLVLWHSGLVPEAKELRELLVENLEVQGPEEHIYGPSVASLLGHKALGVVVVEGGA